MRSIAFAAIAAAFITVNANAADSNGYVAQYECRAGGPHCNVDVPALVNRPCQQIIKTTTTPTNNWSAIDWSNDVICVEAGDHTARGTLTLGASGTSSKYKVLRYYRSGDTDDDPWNQSPNNRAIVAALDPHDRDYWIIHRLSFTQRRTTPHIDFPQGSTSNNIIISRILGEGIGSTAGDESIIFIKNASDIWVQNSVVRNCQVIPGRSFRAINWGDVTRVRLVNNEVYDCAKGIANAHFGDSSDVVVENNDIYVTPSRYTDCNGNFTPNGSCSIVKFLMNLASGGTSQATPVRVVHNRIWGARKCDTTVSCSGGGAAGHAMGGGHEGGGAWTLARNNIIFDSSGGIIYLAQQPGTVTQQHSVIGNIIWNIQTFPGDKPLTGIEFYPSNGGSAQSNEVYLNTLIDVHGSASLSVLGSNSDVRCNVLINSEAPSVPTGAGTQIDYNAYYGTRSANETNQVSMTVSARANNAAYAVGDIISTGAASACTAMNDSDCYLYEVTVPGTSAVANPGYCATLGCTMTDGTMTVQAIRGPYRFYRKLRTVAGGEAVIVPYAVAYSSAPEVRACPSTTGSRLGIGINDQPL
jgi:hypothetical protein